MSAMPPHVSHQGTQRRRGSVALAMPEEHDDGDGLRRDVCNHRRVSLSIGGGHQLSLIFDRGGGSAPPSECGEHVPVHCGRPMITTLLAQVSQHTRALESR